MKTTIKISTFIVALVAFFSISAQAQTSKTKLSIGVESGIPIGDFSDTHNWNLGGSIQADIPVASKLFVTANAGYNNFFGKDVTVGGTTFKATDIQLLPVKAGLKYFPANNFYVQGEAGASFLLNKSDFNGKTAAFVYAPQVGVQFPVSASSYIDAGVRYERSTNFTEVGDAKANFLGIRVAYAFDLK